MCASLFYNIEVSLEKETPKAYLFFFVDAEVSHWVPKGRVDNYDEEDGTADIETTWLMDLEVIDGD